MASQLAQQLSQFGRDVGSMSGSGISAGATNYVNARSKALEQKKLETEIDAAKQKETLDAIMPTIAAALQGGDDGWSQAQSQGFVPKKMTRQQAEGLMYRYLGDKAYETVLVGDATSSTGSRYVPKWQATGMEGPNKTPLVEVSNTQEKEESKAYGKELVSEYTAIRERADAARKSLQQYEVARNINLQASGPLEPFKVASIALAEGLGFDPEAIGIERADNAMAYQGIMQNMVLIVFSLLRPQLKEKNFF